MTLTTTTHIWLDGSGVAWIDDTNTKVIEVVLDRISQGWSAEEIHFQHPHLSLAQIYSALGYYYDHKEELDEQIDTRYRCASSMRVATSPQISREELEARLESRPDSVRA